MFVDVLMDALSDCVRDLPFLFVAFLLLELLEHHAAEWMNRTLARVNGLGPLVGAFLGAVPQCGFSIMASDFYSGGVISLGTLLAVFLSTSDEALIILMSNPGHMNDVLRLIGVKIVLALIWGYVIELIIRITKWKIAEKHQDLHELCENVGGEEEGEGPLRSALRHTLEVFVFLFLFTLALNFLIEVIGMKGISRMLLSDTVFQPVLAALIGLIPNCAASVILTELYVEGAISFGSAVAGLCSGAGLGLVVLWRTNRNKKENLTVTGILLATAIISGVVLQFLFP